MHNIKINHSNLPVVIDSGSPLNILHKKSYTSIKPSPLLTVLTTKIFAFGSKKPLSLLGTLKATVSANRQQITANFYVTK